MIFKRSCLSAIFVVMCLAAMSNVHTPEYIEFIARLRNVRLGKRINQRELAARLGKPQSYVSKVETCERRIDVIETAQWCFQLDISISDVLPRELILPAAMNLKAESEE